MCPTDQLSDHIAYESIADPSPWADGIGILGSTNYARRTVFSRGTGRTEGLEGGEEVQTLTPESMKHNILHGDKGHRGFLSGETFTRSVCRMNL